MNVRAHFDQEKSAAKRRAGATRLAFFISVDATPEETELIGDAEFVVTSTPCPIKLFQFSDKRVFTGANLRPVTRGEESEAEAVFVKSRLPLASYCAAAHLRIAYPGTVHFGFVNREDEQTLRDWLTTELPVIAENISAAVQRALSATSAASGDDIHAETRTIAQASPVAAPITVTHEPMPSCGRIIYLDD